MINSLIFKKHPCFCLNWPTLSYPAKDSHLPVVRTARKGGPIYNLGGPFYDSIRYVQMPISVSQIRQPPQQTHLYEPWVRGLQPRNMSPLAPAIGQRFGIEFCPYHFGYGRLRERSVSMHVLEIARHTVHLGISISLP